MVGILDGAPSGGSSTLRLLPEAASMSAGSTRQFTAVGGSGLYAYSVDAGGVGGTINPVTGLYQAPGAEGTDTVTVTDSTGAYYSATAMVTSSVPLSITPTSTSVNAGGSAAFTASGGSGIGYSFSIVGSLLGNIVALTGAYTAPWSVDTLVVRVTDSLSNTADASVSVTAPTAVHISPSSATLDAHGSVTFSASGGSGPGNYTFSIILPPGFGTIVALTGAYTAPWTGGTATIHVVDANTSGTADAPITVNPPAALVINPASTSIYDTGSVTFTASGGSGTYSYFWVSGPGGPLSVAGSTYTPGVAGPPNGVVRVHDTFTGLDSFATITVTTVPAALAISPKTITIDAGSSLNFTATGGTLPYSYSWTPSLGTFVDNGNNTATYTAPWSLTTAHIRVTDNVAATDNATVTVNPPPTLVISPGTTSLNIGQSVHFTGSGGTGNPLTNYRYTKTSGAGTLVDNLNGTADYTAPNSETTAVIRLRDSVTLQTSSATVTVNPPPTLTLTPLATNVTAGTVVTLTAGGGSGSYSFSRVSGTGTLAPAGNPRSYTTITAETSVIRLTDTVTNNTLVATVIAFFPLTISPSSASVPVTSTYPFSASGGIPPYTYSVIPPAGKGTIDADGTYHASGGTGAVTVKVEDSLLPTHNSSTAAVTVEPPGVWTIVSIDAGAKSGQYASLALDATTGWPRIAYYESQAKELRLATWNGTVWSTQTVDNAKKVGAYCSLALAPGTGYPRISYYDEQNRKLKYASWNGSTWSKQTVPSSEDVGKYTSLALDSSGNAHMSYYDETNDNLKYAWWNGSSWSTKTVDTPGSVGLNTSLALEPATNNPRISYYNTTPDDLKFAYSTDGGLTWPPANIKTVDNVGNVGMYTSLALEPATNNPRISYYDVTNKNLKFAYSNDGGATWTKKVVDNTGGHDVGMYTSLALEQGPNYYPHISYYDNTSKDLKYASSADSPTWTTWTLETVDSTSQVGSYTSLRLGPGPFFLPRIAYYDSSAQDLKYAVR